MLTNSRDLNAATDGEVIYFNRGLARFTESDDELASILAHEMAHIVMGHVDAKRQNAASGAAVGLIVDVLLAGVVPVYGIAGGRIFTHLGARVGASQFSPTFESEADYVAMYLMARAGFQLNSAPNLWRRIAVAHPEPTEQQPLSSHPTAPERFVLLDRTVREITKKLKRGDSLVPNSLNLDTGVIK